MDPSHWIRHGPTSFPGSFLQKMELTGAEKENVHLSPDVKNIAKEVGET